MEKLPAITGWLWVKQGFALFRKQPAEMSTLFLSYMFLMLALGIIPVLGQILPMVLVPVFGMSFMQACAQIEEGRKVYPNLLLAGFRSPAFTTLLKLGALYLLAAVIAVAASALIDGGLFWQIMSGQRELDPATVRESHMSLAILFAGLVYTPAAMAFWYAAPLVAWKKMGVGKAVFYSFFAVHRSGKAFLVYGLAWMLIGVLLPVLVTSTIAVLMGRSVAVMLLLLPLSLMLTVVMYCSFYPTYTTIFGRPEPDTATK
jgi:nitrogen fixation-related uncharacterized protein